MRPGDDDEETKQTKVPFADSCCRDSASCDYEYSNLSNYGTIYTG